MTQQVIHPEADQQVTPQHRPTSSRPRGTRETGGRNILERFAWLVALVLVFAIVAIGYLTTRGDDPVEPATVVEEQVQLQQEKEIMRGRASGQRQAPSTTRDLSQRPAGLLEGTE